MSRSQIEERKRKKIVAGGKIHDTVKKAQDKKLKLKLQGNCMSILSTSCRQDNQQLEGLFGIKNWFIHCKSLRARSSSN